MPLSKGGAKLSSQQRGALGEVAGALLDDEADPVASRAAFLLFAEDILPVGGGCGCAAVDAPIGRSVWLALGRALGRALCRPRLGWEGGAVQQGREEAEARRPLPAAACQAGG